jgi:hypothetical protein
LPVPPSAPPAAPTSRSARLLAASTSVGRGKTGLTERGASWIL